MAVALSVNLNKIALLRNSRDGNYPNVTEHGRQILELGAQGLTVHPRPDQRHIRPHDVIALSALVKSFSHTEFNIEGNPLAPAKNDYPGLLALVEQTRPHQCTLVPDSDSQLTSDHGFDLTQSAEVLAPILSQLKRWGVRSSLFMDPDLVQIDLAKQVGADRIELYTGPYAWNFGGEKGRETFQRYYEAAQHAHNIGLGVNAGHDLNLENLSTFCSVPGLQEVSIGHALTIDALQMGLPETVSQYLSICAQASPAAGSDC